MPVEGEGYVMADPVFPGHFSVLLYRIHIVQKGPLGDRYTLGLSGAAGGVDHIGKAIRLGQIDPAMRLPSRLCKDLLYLLLCQHHSGIGVLQHIPDPLLRIGGIHRYIGSTRLVDSDHGNHKFLYPVHLDDHRIIFLYALGDQPCGNAVGFLIQPGITALP